MGHVVTSHQLSKSIVTIFMVCRFRILICFLCPFFLKKVKKKRYCILNYKLRAPTDVGYRISKTFRKIWIYYRLFCGHNRVTSIAADNIKYQPFFVAEMHRVWHMSADGRKAIYFENCIWKWCIRIVIICSSMFSSAL